MALSRITEKEQRPPPGRPLAFRTKKAGEGSPPGRGHNRKWAETVTAIPIMGRLLFACYCPG
jgi:hypothetical protein